uniref:Pentacotripeptide-repeat region of PRORP domain-containing protein n=1 Tax=Globisporangium ultimum (strain ATCC 200006 / CBS 805.95 / DAOM BR144) TaxID=431595 RepID=K3WWW1_GLOUD
MIRARRLLVSGRRSQQLVLTNGRTTGANALSTLAAIPSRFSSALLEKNALLSASLRSSQLTGTLQQRRWQSGAPSSAYPHEDEAVRKFMEELNSCRETGNWRQALKLLDRIDKHGYALDPQMYERAIAACARMGKVEVLPGLLQNMTVDDILPTSATVDYIMQAYLAREEWKLIVDHAVDVTGKGVPLSDAAFHAVMEGCGQMRDAHSAKTVFNNVWKKCGVAVNTSHYAATIRAVGMGGRPDMAVNLFNIMEEKAGITADESVFNQLIRAQIVNQALPQALQTFATVNDRGLMLHEPIYTATIDALIKNGDYWQAGRLFDQMISYGMNPSVFCYGRIMVAYVRTGKNNVAAACWKKIVEANEPSPALMKYTKLLGELATTSDSKLTLAVFDHIFSVFDHDLIRDSTYSLAIRANGRMGRTQTAIDLFDTFVRSREESGKHLPRAAGIYLSVFNALSRDTERDPKQNTRDAKRVWDIMAKNVPVILSPAYASLAGVFASSGELDTLNVLLEHAGQSFADISREENAENMDHVVEEEEAHDAHEEEVDASDLHDELLYNGVISGFSKARDDHSEHISAYLKLMKQRGLKINDSIVRASTDAFVKFENWQLMTKLVDYIDVKALQNADLCFGDTISKLLEAEAWYPARHWISAAHKLNVQPPIRGKMEILRHLCESKSDEWRIAYALALETLSFKQMVDVNVESVADAVDICMNANRSDLVMKLFDRMTNHNSHKERPNSTRNPVTIPLRMYKQTVLALMRDHTTDPESRLRSAHPGDLS